jgi:hypothetical protein
MRRRFGWGGSTSVSTESSLEITLNSKILWAVSQVSHTRSGTGRHGGHPSQMPEANIAAVPDDTEVIPPKCPEANIAAVPDDTEVIPPKSRRAKVIAEKLSATAPLREITVPAKLPPTQDGSENPGVKPVATKKGSSSFTGKILLYV